MGKEKEKTEEEEDEEEEEFYDKGPQNYNQGIASTMKELPKFDVSEFFNIQNVSDEVKDLLDVMTR